MNQRPQGLKVEKAMAGFLQYKSAESLASVTWLRPQKAGDNSSEYPRLCIVPDCL